MVECAKGKKGAQSPPQLIVAWWCERYQALPKSGGIYEQDYREMYLNDILPRIYDAVRAWRKGSLNLESSDTSIIMWLVKTGMMNKNG